MGMQQKRKKIKPCWLRMCLYKAMGRMILGTHIVPALPFIYRVVL